MDVFKDARAAAAFSPEKMKKVNLFDTARMFCDVYGLNAGQEQTAHAHAGSDKVYYVIDGTGHFRIGEEERTVGSGVAILAPAGSSHAVRNPGPGPLTLLVFMAPKP
jgi:mannose-6-phosphate isomerase-like protein (cupin superfamily)